MARRSYTKHTQPQVDEAKAAFEGGMSLREISQSLGTPLSTLHTWKKKGWVLKKEPTSPQLATKEPAPEPIPIPNGRMSLEDFVALLKSLVLDYEFTKTKLHELEKSVARWQQVAGKLNEQIGQAARR